MENNPINLDELLSKDENVQEEVQDNAQSDVQNPVEEEIQEEVQDNAQNDETEVDTTQEEVSEDIQEETTLEEQVDSMQDTQQQEVQEGDATTEQPAPQGYEFKDDFIKKAVEYYETYGTLTPYLEATSVDYDQLSDVQVMKLAFDKENADLSDKARERLFAKSLEKYNLDEYDEEEKEIGEALLKRDATKLRNSLKEEQQQFIQSIQTTQQEPQISEEELEAQRAEARKVIESGVKSVVKDNMIRVASGEEGINYQLDNINNVIDYAQDSSKFLSTFVSENGNVDWNKWTQVVAFAENPTQFINELIKHGKSLGRKSMEAELKNPSQVKPTKEVIDTADFDRPSDNPLEFLKGMKITRK